MWPRFVLQCIMGYTKASLKLQLRIFNTAKIYEFNFMSLQISQEWLACYLATFNDNLKLRTKKGGQVTS